MEELYSNESVSSTAVDQIEHHAAFLGHQICQKFEVLNCIVTRHESLLGKRWIKKSTLERRNLLLLAWPDMSA